MMLFVRQYKKRGYRIHAVTQAELATGNVYGEEISEARAAKEYEVRATFTIEAMRAIKDVFPGIKRGPDPAEVARRDAIVAENERLAAERGPGVHVTIMKLHRKPKEGASNG